MTPHLVRLRANPKKIRVALRRSTSTHGYWAATVSSREKEGVLFCAHHRDPMMAVERALSRASKANLDGIDNGCSWTYEHPQKTG